MLSFFPRDVLDWILDLIESVSEGFPTYSYSDLFTILFLYNRKQKKNHNRKTEEKPLYQCTFVSFIKVSRKSRLARLLLFQKLMQSEFIIYGLVRKCVKLSPFS